MKLNGKELILKAPQSLLEFLSTQGYSTEKIAVELNGHIVPKNSYSHTMVEQNDSLEVVSFVGGG